jgi:hypothetical protein
MIQPEVLRRLRDRVTLDQWASLGDTIREANNSNRETRDFEISKIDSEMESDLVLLGCTAVVET